MFGRTSVGGHRVMCRLFTLFGAVPRTVPQGSTGAAPGGEQTGS